MLAVAACSGGGDASGELPLTDSSRAPSQTGPAKDLAPSQIAAPTVAPPDVPPSCELADLDLWTAQVVVGERSADAVIRVLNQGAAWCEPDIYASPQIDPLIEPDVWLERGGWADLVVGPSGEGCDDPAMVSSWVTGEAALLLVFDWPE